MKIKTTFQQVKKHTRIFKLSALAISLSLLTSTPVTAQGTDPRDVSFGKLTGKKLIEYGWDVPTPEFVRDNIREMENLPFEGVIFRLPSGGGDIFQTRSWDKNQQAIRDQEKILRQLKWNKFTDNFLAMYAASDMDWYSDDDWKKVLAHVTFCARAARLSGSVGLLFDPEPYGFNPWNYSQQKHADTKSFAEYSQQAYKRGRQFMRAMSGEFPNVKLLMFFQYALFHDVANHPDPAARKAALQNFVTWNLMLPFLNGMLEESGKNVQLLDGNEPAYYYQKERDFYRAYWTMRQGAKINIPDYLKPKFETNVRAAQALYMDHVFDRQGHAYMAASGMTPEERARWFEHNVYYALKTTDEYAWLYSERMNWWKTTNSDRKDWWEGENFPPGIVEAITSAKRKLREGKELGYDMDETFQNAQLRLSRMLQEKLVRRTATIPRLANGVVPAIDGKLDERIYQEVRWLEPFVTLISPKDEQAAPVATRAWVAYDENNLYIAYRCDEPDMSKQKVHEAVRDGEVWNGETVELSILKPGQPADTLAQQYYHFILNPANVQWDSIDTGKESNLAFNAQWQSAIARDDKGWSAEIALPWKEIGVNSVQKGQEIRGNLARFRVTTEKTEHSSWSQFIAGFQEPENFGVLVFD